MASSCCKGMSLVLRMRLYVCTYSALNRHHCTDAQNPIPAPEQAAEFLQLYTAPSKVPGRALGDTTPSPAQLLVEEFLDDNLTQICFKRDVEQDITIVRTTTLLQCTPMELVQILYDAEMLPLWDIKVLSCSVVTEFSSTTDLIHLVYKSFSSVYKFRDLSLLRSIVPLTDGGYCILLYSVNHPSCPEHKDFTRCYFQPSGYIITPVGTRTFADTASDAQRDTALSIQGKSFCLLTNIVQSDKESVLVFALDLLSESQELLHSFSNLHSLLASTQAAQCQVQD
uniref:PCTP-like protein n=1 Tax=Lygus hesperus TaxID=30085 RepID=A0A0A9VX91_LYGHE